MRTDWQETPEDRAAELVVAERFRDQTGAASLERCEEGARMDYLIRWKGAVYGRTQLAWLEVKRVSKPKWEGRFRLKLQKWTEGIAWAKATKARFMLLVAFADRDLVYTYNEADVDDGFIQPTVGAEASVSIPLELFRTPDAVRRRYAPPFPPTVERHARSG